MPSSTQRILLWKNAFSSSSIFESSINFDEIAEKYEISGGAISNVVRFCSLKAYKRPDKMIKKVDLITGIKKELHKEGKVV